MTERALLGLGSNHDPLANLARARGALAAHVAIARVTTPRASAPEGGGEGLYWNQLVELASAPGAEELRALVKDLEAALGRERGPGRPVVIDIDVLRVDGEEAAELRGRSYWALHLAEL